MTNVNHRIDLASSLTIGSVTCRNRVFLAPMSGVTDRAFRKLAWRLGAGLVFSEMVASEALVTGQQKMAVKAQSAGLPIHAVQIAGHQAKWMALAAKLAVDNGADLIDINMGCPAKRVTHGQSGSALMRDLDHALTLIDAVVEAVEVPVTLKMRLGWDDNSMNAPQLAARAQSAGIAMISVHGRTRCQFYRGEADWRAVGLVRKQTRLPMVVNGDIVDRASARTALDHSGADAIMVGRGCYGAPWLPGQLALASDRLQYQYGGRPDSPQALVELMEGHLDEVLALYGIDIGIRQFRKHLGWYLDKQDIELCPTLRRTLMTSSEHRQIRAMIGRVVFDRQPSAAA